MPKSHSSLDTQGCYQMLDLREHRLNDRVGEPSGAVGASEAFEYFQPLAAAASGWGPNMQHGGPVSALLTRAMEQHQQPDSRISRVAVEILGVVPMSQVRVRAWVARPGRRIAQLQAEMQAQQADATWQTVAAASAWQLATSDTHDAAYQAATPVPLPNIDTPNDTGLLDSWRIGFVNALDWHIESEMNQRGSATMAWLRLKQGIVAGETPSDLQRVMAIADTANGVGARLDARDWVYLNTDLVVHLFDAPTGDWIGLQAETSVGRDGIALSSAIIHTETGPIGQLAQNVLLQRRASN